LDGSQPVGKGGEAVEVIRRVVVIAARSTIAIAMVGDRCIMLLVVVATSFPLGVVPFAMTVVDAGSKTATIEAVAKIWLVDLLATAMGAYRAVGARLRPIVGVLPSQALCLGCCNVEMSASFCNLGSLEKALEYLEYSGHVGRWRGEDLMAVVVQDELIFEVPGPWWRSTPSCNPGDATLAVVEIFFALADDLLVGPTISAKSVAVKAFCPLLVILTIEGLGVQLDDRDLASAVGVVAVGRGGEDGVLIFSLRM